MTLKWLSTSDFYMGISTRNVSHTENLLALQREDLIDTEEFICKFKSELYPGVSLDCSISAYETPTTVPTTIIKQILKAFLQTSQTVSQSLSVAVSAHTKHQQRQRYQQLSNRSRKHCLKLISQSLLVQSELGYCFLLVVVSYLSTVGNAKKAKASLVMKLRTRNWILKIPKIQHTRS